MTDKTAIDWPHWGKLKEAKVFEALALLDNTEPGEEMPEQADTTPTYRKRLRLLLAAIGDREQFAPGTLNMGNPQLHGVSLIAVGAWARRNQISLPAGFPEVQEFTAQARPPCVPPALLELDPGTTIKVVDSIGTYSGVAWCPAGQYKEVLEDIIKRQADGFFTVGEAAQILKEVHADLDIETMVARMYGASMDGQRLVRDAGDRLPLSPDSPKREFANLVYSPDINQWLDEQRAGYRFPDAAAVASVQAPANAGGKVWTDARKIEVREYRDKHGLKKTAEHYKVSQATISKHIPAGKARPKPRGHWD